MKQNRTYKKLTDVCDIQYGYPFDSACFSTSSDDGMPLIRIRDVKNGYTTTYYKGDYSKEYIIHKGDYLVGMDGEFNIAPWRSEDALLNQRVCKMASKSVDVSMGFLYRFLMRELKKIEDETPFVTVKHLSAKRLNQVFLDIPPLYTQSRIVSELDLLQSLIDNQQAQLKELDTLAQSIFYDMFGDPVENEKKWPIASIKDVCDSIVRGPFGSALKKEFFVEPNDSTYKVYEQKHAIQKDATIGSYYIDDKRFQSLKRFELQAGDIIMSCSGTIGELFEIPLGAEKGIMNQALLKFTLNKRIDKRYFLFAMDFIKESFETKGTGLQNIGSVNTIKSTKVSLPPLPLQQEFAEKIELIERQKLAISQSIAETQKLFDYTMDKYFG